MIIRALITTSLGIFISTSVAAADASSNLINIYQKAIDQDPVLAATRFSAQAGAEKAVQGKSLLLPQLAISGDVKYAYSKTEYDQNGTDSSNKSDSRSVALQFSQSLYDSSKSSNYRQSKLVADQSKIQFKIAEQNLILRVAQAYFDVLSAEENLSVAKAQGRAFSESLERAKLTFKVGTATKTDMLEAQARYDLARATEISSTNLLEIAKQQLNSIIGEAPGKLQSIRKDAQLLTIKPTDMKYWVDTAVANNFDLQVSQSNLNISKLEIKKLKSDRIPKVEFVAGASNSVQYVSFLNTDSTNTNLSVGIQVSMPLYTGGLMNSRIREAELLRFQQQQSTVNSQRQVVLQTQQAYLNAMNGKQQIDALKQALVSSDSALQATRKGVEVGVRTNLDLLDAQQQYFGTERDYTIAKYSYLLNVLNLKAAAGTLSEIDIEELNKLLVNSQGATD